MKNLNLILVGLLIVASLFNNTFVFAQGKEPDGGGGGKGDAIDSDLDGYSIGQGDCNDGNAAVHPGAIEICNGVDDDCDGLTDLDDPGIVYSIWYLDNDNDGYGTTAFAVVALCQPPGYAGNTTDCNDYDPAINPGAIEVCNGIDENCDGTIDNGLLITFYADTDSDSYGNPSSSTVACFAPSGYVTDNTDCNDTNPAIHPAATEVCNAIDDNCNGWVDMFDPTVLLSSAVNWYHDADHDGYGIISTSVISCTQPPGYAALTGDCDNYNSSIHPDATEVCNLTDDNCNGVIDEGVQLTFYADADGDTYGNAASTTLACSVPSGYVSDITDCNDANASIHPGATEVCNNADDDCDAQIDEGEQLTFFADTDADGYGDSTSTAMACTVPSGYVADNTDCNDADVTVHPGVNDICNSIDDNCFGGIDENAITATLSGGTSCADNTLTAASSGAVPINKIVWKRNGAVINKLWDPLPGYVNFSGLSVTPIDISIDAPDNLLYVADYGSHRILRISTYGGPTTIEVPSTLTQAVYVNPANDIYVVDDVPASIRKYPSGGAPSYTVAGQQNNPGPAPNQLDGAVDVIEDPNGGVDVVDRSNSRVIWWPNPNDGGIIKAGGSYGSGLNQFINPMAMCYDNAGNLYVSDNGNNRIMKYAPGATEGVIVAGTGAAGNSRFELNSPRGIVVDNDGDLFIADHANGRIQEWTAGATEGITLISELNGPVSIGFDLAGNMYIAEFEGSAVRVATRVTPAAPYLPVFTYAPTMNGSYTVEITDNNGCTAFSNPVVINYIPRWFQDKDGDGFGDLARSTTQCDQPSGFVADSTDCNDAIYSANPAASEVCNSIDDNCNGAIDEIFDMDQDGFTACGGDCDDFDPTVNIGAFEMCDGKDNDCDGLVDEGIDLDQDGFTSCDGDCNDQFASIHPGALETCNGLDDNCDSQIDEGVLLTFYADADGDTYGTSTSSVQACTASSGYVSDNTDCNDANSAINPGVSDICNSIDDNCDNVTDENAITATVTPAGTATTCTGIAITLTANSGAGISYQWKKGNASIAGATNSTYSTSKAANYKVTESNSFGCSATSAVTTLSVVSAPSATITPLGNLDICVAGSVVLQANSGVGYAYQWMKGANLIAGATNQNYTATKTGTYKVTVTNSNNCSKTSAGTKVTKSCKLGDEDGEALPGVLSELHIYPNPTSGKFMIELSLPEEVSVATVHVISILGQTVLNEKVEVTDGMLRKEIQLDNAIAAGSYMIQVITDDQVYSSQLIYQR